MNYVRQGAFLTSLLYFGEQLFTFTSWIYRFLCHWLYDWLLLQYQLLSVKWFEGLLLSIPTSVVVVKSLCVFFLLFTCSPHSTYTELKAVYIVCPVFAETRQVISISQSHQGTLPLLTYRFMADIGTVLSFFTPSENGSPMSNVSWRLPLQTLLCSYSRCYT